MERDEAWKEQLGFLSGTVLVWGTLLLSLWPTVARFQTGINAHFWSTISAGESPKPGWDGYQMLVAPLALGISAIFFSILHIFSRGLWIGIHRNSSNDSLAAYASKFLHRLADASYGAVFAQWLFAAATIIVLLLTFVLWTTMFLVGRKRLKHLKTTGSPPYRRIKLFGFFLFFFLIYGATIEMCYVASLTADKRMASRSKGEYVEVIVTLGGATSDINDAKLELKDIDGNSSTRLDLLSLGDGQYACYIPSSDLPHRQYLLEFTYPHLSFSMSYPFLSSRVQRSWPLVVVP